MNLLNLLDPVLGGKLRAWLATAIAVAGWVMVAVQGIDWKGPVAVTIPAVLGQLAHSLTIGNAKAPEPIPTPPNAGGA